MKNFYRDYLWFTIILLCAALFMALALSKWYSSCSVSEVSSFPIVLIDAGHGGEDGGAVSVSGSPESQYNLSISIKLNDLLNLLGYETYMLRTEDQDLHTEGSTIAQRKVSDLRNRVKIANGYQNAVLISLHQNYFSDSRYYGLQTFYYSEKSRSIAEQIQSAYKYCIAPTNRRLAQHKKGVFLLENVHCSAVLIECGFLSNHNEEQLLSNNSYQQKLASIIAVSTINSLTG